MTQNKEVLLMISPTPSERFRGVARFAHEHNWFVTIEDRAMPPKDWDGDGVMVTLGTNHQALFKAVCRYRRRGIPVVDLTNARPELKLPRVRGDNDAIARLAAEHLKAHGLTSAAWYSTNRGNVQSQRLAGFERHFGSKVIRLTGLAPDELAERLAAIQKPLGVFTYSDYDATKVLNACRRAGIGVPDEVAIVGVDDNRLLCENQCVPITSVRHDHERIGYEGAAQLERLMNGSDPEPLEILIPPLGIATRKSTDVFAAADPLVHAAYAMMASEIGNRIPVTALAATLHVGIDTLEAAFRRETGHSIKREMMRMRLEKAVQLLKTTDLKLESVASETGFCNAAHLSNELRAKTGRKASEFRKA